MYTTKGNLIQRKRAELSPCITGVSENKLTCLTIDMAVFMEKSEDRHLPALQIRNKICWNTLKIRYGGEILKKQKTAIFQRKTGKIWLAALTYPILELSRSS